MTAWPWRQPMGIPADMVEKYSVGRRELLPGKWFLCRARSGTRMGRSEHDLPGAIFDGWAWFFFKMRFKLAWRVFTGRADALLWADDMDRDGLEYIDAADGPRG